MEASRVTGQRVGLVIVPSASAILVEARSSVGGIRFGTTEIGGTFAGVLVAGEDGPRVELTQATAHVPVTSLVSGNRLYDNELHQRLNAKRFPTITADLRDAQELGSGRFNIAGDLTIHGETRSQACTAEVALAGTDTTAPSVVVSGSAALDIRDFDIALPSALMLRIYPDVVVRFRVEATLSDSPTDTGTSEPEES
jgi:polyisoprenoid-binding protein YceI